MTELTCIVCPMGCQLTVSEDYSVMGNLCIRGIDYAKKELTNPTRMITSTVRIAGAIYERIPVKTDKEIAKHQIFEVMTLLDDVLLNAPVNINDVVLTNILGTDVNIVTTRSMKKALN